MRLTHCLAACCTLLFTLSTRAASPLALLPDPTGTALATNMIWATPDAPSPKTPYYIAFRKHFSLPSPPPTALLHLFADVRYVLWINGTYVSRGPARFDPQGPEYDTLAIAKFLVPGDNTLVVLVLANASNGKMMHHTPCLTARLDTTPPLTTDATWKWSDHTRYKTPTINWGNTRDNIDARLDDGDWTQPAYDDSAWKSAAPIDGTQWGQLSARRTPLLRETPLTLSFDHPLPITLNPGDQLHLDAGRLTQSYTALDVEADAGTQLELGYEGVTWITRAGRQTLMSTDTYGISQGNIRVKSGHATLHSVQLVERLYPFDNAASFHSSDPSLDRLWAVCTRSLNLYSEDSYVDCADRERTEWMDDDPPAFDVTRIAMTGPAADGSPIFSDARLLGALLRRTALTLQPAGWVKAHTASDRFDIHAKMEDRACDWVQGARRYYDSTGDQMQIREIWPALVTQMNWFLAQRTPRGLVQAREWVIWGNPMGYQTFEGTALNAFVYKALVDAAYLATALGEKDQAATYTTAAHDLATAVNTLLWDDTLGTYTSGYWGPDAKLQNPKKPLTLAITNHLVAPTLFPALFALDQDLVPADRKPRVTAYLLQHRTEPARIMAYYYLFKQLYLQHDPKLDQEVLDSFRTQWKGMAESQWQTTWEEFTGGSKAHIYGIFPAYFLSTYVLGVQVDAPVSQKHLLLEPRLANLDFAEGKVVTEFGVVSVSWKKADGGLTFSCTIPQGVHATLRLPGKVLMDGKEQTGDVPLDPGTHTGHAHSM